jgi:hypothetical protein
MMPRRLFDDLEVAKPGRFDPPGERRGAAWITHSMNPGEGESPLLSPDLAPKGVAQ